MSRCCCKRCCCNPCGYNYGYGNYGGYGGYGYNNNAWALWPLLFFI